MMNIHFFPAAIDGHGQFAAAMGAGPAMAPWQLQALQYGVLGFSLVMLVGTYSIILTEQKRAGAPRKGIIRFACVFMGFCLLLMLFNGYLQVSDARGASAREGRLKEEVSATKRAWAEQKAALEKKHEDEITEMDRKLHEANFTSHTKSLEQQAKSEKSIDHATDRLERIQGICIPLLNLKNGIIEDLPENLPQKQQLRDFRQALLDALKN